MPLIMQLSDDEVCLYTTVTPEEAHQRAVNVAKDIIAFGFDVKKTFIFSNFDYMT